MVTSEQPPRVRQMIMQMMNSMGIEYSGSGAPHVERPPATEQKKNPTPAPVVPTSPCRGLTDHLSSPPSLRRTCGCTNASLSHTSLSYIIISSTMMKVVRAGETRKSSQVAARTRETRRAEVIWRLIGYRVLQKHLGAGGNGLVRCTVEV